MALPLGSDIEYLGTQSTGGVVLGKTATTLVGFYGTTPVDQPANIAASTDTTTTTSTTTALTTDLDSLRVKFNSLLTSLEEIGILASS